MSIATEITRLQTAKSNLKTAIENKGVTVPSATLISGYASLVNQISGGLSNTDAILIVTVPTGSTVTATKGGVTLTSTIWVQNADNTLDTAIFTIPSSTFDSNAWTVTATLGGESSSDTIVINSAKEYSLELLYDLYLVKDGVVNSNYTATKGGYTSATISYGEGYVAIETGEVSGSYSLLYFTPQILLSEYDYLVFDGCARGYAEANKFYQSYGVVNTVSSSGGTQSTFSSSGVLLSGNASSYTARSMQYIDISAVSSTSYVGFQTAGSSYYHIAGGIRCYNFYLSNTAPST